MMRDLKRGAKTAFCRHNVTLNGLDNVLFEHVAVGERCGEIDPMLSDTTNSHLPGVYIGATRQEYAAYDRSAWEWAAQHGYCPISATTGQPITSRECVHGTLLCSPVGSSTTAGFRPSA